MKRRVVSWAAALTLGVGLGPAARGGAVTFTGNVEADMPTNGKDVFLVPGVQPGQVAQSDWITQSGWVNGWVVKDLRLDYNKAADTMQVGVNFYSIAGDPSGNPAGADPRVEAMSGSDPANLGGRKSITVEFAAPSAVAGQVGAPVIVAGVPEVKSSAYTGTDGFTVALAGSNAAFQDNYTTQLNSAMGNLAFSPSPAHPDFEFSIAHWSQFKALTGPGGYYVSAYAGSPDDVVAGESKLPWFHMAAGSQTVTPGGDLTPPGPTIHPNIPEPTAVLGWTLMAGGVTWALRRSRKITGRA
jgi:hypothetical protein